MLAHAPVGITRGNGRDRLAIVGTELRPALVRAQPRVAVAHAGTLEQLAEKGAARSGETRESVRERVAYLEARKVGTKAEARRRPAGEELVETKQAGRDRGSALHPFAIRLLRKVVPCADVGRIR